MNYELLRLMVSLLEGCCAVLSIVCAYYYKNVIIAKHPINGSVLVVGNLVEMAIIFLMIIFSMLNGVLIFVSPPVYFFKITFLILCMAFIILFILKSIKDKNASGQ